MFLKIHYFQSESPSLACFLLANGAGDTVLLSLPMLLIDKSLASDFWPKLPSETSLLPDFLKRPRNLVLVADSTE
jgi:hypothetical protein